MDTAVIVILGCVLLLVLLLCKVPVAFSMGIAGLVGIIMLQGFSGISILLSEPFDKVTIFSLSVIGMFVLMGQLAFVSGVSSDAYDASRKLVGRVPGALGIATIVACASFGAACGSSMAETAAMGKVSIPEMRKAGYDKKFASGIVASAGLLAWLIPPSVELAIFGIITEQSIGKLLVAGFIPGILTAVVLSSVIILVTKIKPELVGRETAQYTLRERLSALPKLVPVIILFIVVMGGIYAGIFTPTEAGAVGALAACVFVVIGLTKRQTTWKAITGGMIETVEMITMMFMIFVGAGLFSFFIAYAGLPQLIEGIIVASNMSPAMLLFFICLLYIPLGMFLEPMSIQLLTLPIVFPIIIGLGFDGIWFGIIICKLIELSMLTPPVGLHIYVVKSIVPDMSLEEAFSGITPFLLAEIGTLLILILFPQISLWLPGLMME